MGMTCNSHGKISEPAAHCPENQKADLYIDGKIILKCNSNTL
jgi:hypothetical protein